MKDASDEIKGMILNLAQNVNKRFDKVDQRLGRIEKVQAEHTDKVDALMVEMHNFKEDFGVYKVENTIELDRIKEHVGLPTSIDGR